MSRADPTFWLQTFEQHGGSILAFLKSRVGRRDLAEDLLQETFVRAMRRRATLPDAHRMRSYLMTTAHRLVIDQRRRKRAILFSEATRDDAFSLEDSIDDRSESASDVLDSRRLKVRLDREIRALRDNQRIAFQKAVVERTPYAQIAEEQGWTLQQVKINVYRARRSLMAQLRDVLHPTPEGSP